MSMPAPQMQAMMGAQPGNDAMGGGGQPPMGAPMATPQPQDGVNMSGITNVQIAIELLEQAISSLGSGSKEGSAVLKALSTLSSAFAEGKGRDLIPAELMHLMGQVGPGQGGQGQAPQPPPMQGVGGPPPGAPM